MSQFDTYADDYDAGLQRGLAITGESQDYFATARIAWMQHWLSRLGIAPESLGNWLDFGCGSGFVTTILANHFPHAQVTGVDPSMGLLHRASEQHPHPRVVYRHLNLNDQNQRFTAISQFDAAHCSGVFHHIPPSERQQALNWIRQSLRPGGLFFLWENNPWNPGTRWVMKRIPFDRDAITLTPVESRRRLSDAGFEIIGVEYRFYFPAILSALRPLEMWLTRCPLGGQYCVLARRI